MIRLLIPLVFLFLLANLRIQGQNLEGSHWFFGDLAGLSFVEGEPVADTNNILFSSSRTSSISTASGELVFYTNAEVIVDSTHAISPNGNVLSFSSPSGYSLVTLRPNSEVLYDVFFTTPNQNTNIGFLDYYLIHFNVLLDANTGLADFVVGSLDTLLDNSGLAISCLDHSNGLNKWILSHAIDTNNFFAHELTQNGVQSQPVISGSGSYTMTMNNATRKYISSPNSDFLVSCFTFPLNKFELMEFDQSLGQVTNTVLSDSLSYNNSSEAILAASFSPNSRVLYIGSQSQIVQYDLSSSNVSAILASKITVDSATPPFVNIFSDLQLGIDGKIYVIDFRYSGFGCPGGCYLSRIECPNNLTNPAFNDSAISTMNRLPGNRFPTLNQTLFVNADSFQVQMNRDTLCFGDTAQLQAYGSGADQFLWTLPDGTAAPHLSNDTIANPLCFSDTTITYRVVGIARNCTVDRYDTNFITVPVVTPSPSQAQIELLNVTLPLCIGDTATVTFSSTSTNAAWLAPSSTADTLEITTADTIVLAGTARCSTPVYDTLIVDTASSILLTASSDTAICEGDTITLSVNGSNQAQWQTSPYLSDTTQSNPLAFPPVDTFFVATTFLPCTQNDTVRVSVNPNKQIQLSPDSIVLCEDTSLVVSTTSNFQNLEWFPPQWVENSIVNPTRVFEGVEGWLTLNTANRNCTSSDSIFINTINPVEARGSADVLLTCEGYTVQTENNSVGAINYSWRLGGTVISAEAETEVLNYNGEVITLIANNGECVDSTQLFVSLDSALSSEVQPINVFTPNGDGVNDYFELKDNPFIHCSDLKVFTRWGQQVYDSNGMPPRWDGRTFGGEELPTGHYFYILTVNNETITGSVWLRR